VAKKALASKLAKAVWHVMNGEDFKMEMMARWVTETTAEESHGTERKVEATIDPIKTRSEKEAA